MKDELKYIDDFYKTNLTNYNEKANKHLWNKLRWTLFWMRYKWIVGLSAIIIFVGVVFAVYIEPFGTPNLTISKTDNIPEKVEITNTMVNIDNSNVEISTSIIDQVGSSNHNLSTENNIESLDKTDGVNLSDHNLPSNDRNIPTLIVEQTQANYNEEKTIKYDNNNDVDNPTVIINSLLTEIKSSRGNLAIFDNSDSIVFGNNQRTKVLASKQQKFSANIYAGPAYSMFEISANNTEYLTARNSNESNNCGWSLGIDFKLHLNNWVITSGLNYSVYNQSRAYSYNYNEYSEKDSYYKYDTTWIWLFEPPNIGIPIIVGVDSTWVDVYNSVTIENSGINKVKYLEIPLLIGYQVNSNLFTIEFNTGISAGFLLYSNIKAPDFSNINDIVSVSDMNNIMLNFMANATVYYHINSTTSLFISPYYKTNLKSIYTSDYPANQQFGTYGLNMGISIKF